MTVTILPAPTCASVDDMRPVLGGVPRQLLPSLHYEDAGVADLAGPLVGQLEAGGAVRLVFTAVGETGTGKRIGI